MTNPKVYGVCDDEVPKSSHGLGCRSAIVAYARAVLSKGLFWLQYCSEWLAYCFSRITLLYGLAHCERRRFVFKCKTWRHRISCGVMTCLLSAKYSIREAQDNSVLGLFETLDDEVHLAYFDDVIPLGIVIEARLKKSVGCTGWIIIIAWVFCLLRQKAFANTWKLCYEQNASKFNSVVLQFL